MTPHRADFRLWYTVPTLVVLAALLVASARGENCASPYNAVCDLSNTHGGRGEGGSAALVGVSGEKGLVLGCAHYFTDGVGKVTLTFSEGFKTGARVLAIDKQRDLSAMECARPPDVEPLLIREAKAEDGPFYVLGYPYFGGFRMLTGTTLLRPYVQWEIRLNCRSYSGFSGGPVVNKHGELCAVCVTTSQNTSSHVNSAAIKPFLATLLDDE